MVEFKRILCPIDLSEASVRPLAYAGALARWYRGDVTVFHAAFAPMPMTIPDVAPPVQRQELMQQLDETVSAAGIDATNVTAVVEEGDAATEIVKQAATMRADLVVMGTHGRSGFDRLLLGSVTEKVLHKAPCPVLTVPPHAPATLPLQPELNRIVCAIDFSPASIRSFHHAVDVGRRAGASVLVVHSIEWLADEEPLEWAHFSVPEFRRYLMDDARKRLAELLSDETTDGGDITTTVVVGRAYREILRLAEENKADLIVMGAQGRGGAALALFGSSTQQVVRGASCAVLTVR